MGDNYLKRREQREQAVLDAGEQIGMQKMGDYVQVALRDPKVMGKDVMGRGRMEKLFKGVKELSDRYHLCFTFEPEADHRQEELDARLREIWGDDLSTFYERYPQIKKMGYGKARKEWK